MIHVERGPAPAILSSAPFRRYQKDLEQFFRTPRAERGQKSFSFPPITDHPELMAALSETFSSKCAYCETTLDSITLELESFRPRLRTVGRDGKVSAEHYWWLAYEWSNLLASCMVCNRLKGSRFPIRGRRARPGTVGEDLQRERPLLLDPCLDDPESHLVYDDQGRVASATEEGRTTIEVLGLNREALVKARFDVLEELKETWEALTGGAATALSASSLAALHAPALPHLAPRRQFLEQWSRELAAERPDLQPLFEPFLRLRTELPGVAGPVDSTFEDYRRHLVAQESYSAEGRGGKESYYAKTRLIERVVIRNFKALREVELTFPPAGDKGPCFVLLGENGTGKSSILKAVALALMGREHHRRLRDLDASSYVTFGENEGHVHVYLTGVPEPVELTFRRGEREFGLKPADPKVLLLGYGATRLLPRPGTKPVRKFGASKADNLFSPFVPLADANAWLARLGEEKREPMNEGLKQLLLLGKEARVTLDSGPPPVASVELHGQRIPLSDLSDGYQGMAALAADVMGVMGKRWPEMALAEGIVLIDEIDAHLHPRWKMQVVERLRTVFPRLQFLMTTHDPLCLRGLKAEEVAVIRRDARDFVQVLRDLPSPAGLRVDQILTSDLFGMNSTRSPEDDQLFEEYYRLLAMRERTDEEEKELAGLKGRLEGQDLMGKDQRERLMLEAADLFLAQSRNEQELAPREKLKEETRQKIADLWASTGPSGSGR